MLREYAPMSAVCKDERSDFPIYLLRLAEREILDREKRAAERRIREARFPVVKTIDTIDFKAQLSINEQLVRGLMRGEYIDKKEELDNIGVNNLFFNQVLHFSTATRLTFSPRFIPWH